MEDTIEVLKDIKRLVKFDGWKTPYKEALDEAIRCCELVKEMRWETKMRCSD